MNHEEAEKVLDELNNVRPEKLNKDAKRLFDAIMRLADERNFYKQKYEDYCKQIKKYEEKNKQWMKYIL